MLEVRNYKKNHKVKSASKSARGRAYRAGLILIGVQARRTARGLEVQYTDPDIEHTGLSDK